MKIIRNLIFSLLPLVVILLLSESILRLTGFQYSDTPLEVKNLPSSLAQDVARNPSVTFPDWSWTLKKDRDQIWVPGKDSFEEKYTVQKPAEVTRIAALGCSCTWGCFGTTESYPSLLEKMLNQGADKKYEVLNAGVPGYSSYQGLKRLNHAVLPYKPDILTIFFGWNDHWVAGIPDKEIKPHGDLAIHLLNFFERFRTYQALHKLIASLHPRQAPPKASGSLDQMPLRVSISDYEKNLLEIIRIAQEEGIRPVLITAPAEASKLDSSWVFPFPKEALPKVHEAYNQIVRKVAAQNNIALIDLSAQMETLLKTAPKDSPELFSDGVHFSPFGCEIVAKILLIELKRLQVI